MLGRIKLAGLFGFAFIMVLLAGCGTTSYEEHKVIVKDGVVVVCARHVDKDDAPWGDYTSTETCKVTRP